MFNKAIIFTYLILVITFFAKTLLYLSDFSQFILYHKLYENELLTKPTDKIKATRNNALIMTFWSIRTLEQRENYLLTFQVNNERDYIEEKIETHMLNKILVVAYLIISFKFTDIEILPETLTLMFGIISSKSKFLITYPVLSRMTDHKAIMFYKQKSGNEMEVTIETCSSSKINKELTNQGRYGIAEHMHDLQKTTTLPNNMLHFLMSNIEAEKFKRECETNYKAKVESEPFINHIEYDQNLLKRRLAMESGLGTNPKSSPNNTITVDNLSERNAELLACTYHIQTTTHLNVNAQTIYNSFIVAQPHEKPKLLYSLLEDKTIDYQMKMKTAYTSISEIDFNE